MQKSLLFGFPFVAIMLCGCSSLQAQSRVDPQTVAVYPRGPTTPARTDGASNAPCPAQLKYDSYQGAINLDCFRFPEANTGTPDKTTAYGKAVDSQSARNRLAAILMKHSDDVCTLEMGRLTANEATVNTTLSVLTTGFSAAATIVGGDTAKRILSGLATTSSASRDHVNAEIYRNALSPVVARAIQNRRETLRQAILQQFSSSKENYSADRMILDVNQYHQACSFYYGLGLVVQAVDRQAFEQKDRGRYVTLSLEETGLKIDATRRALAAKGVDGDEKTALNKQLAALIDLQTKLMVERANLGSDADTSP